MSDTRNDFASAEVYGFSSRVALYIRGENGESTTVYLTKTEAARLASALMYSGPGTDRNPSTSIKPDPKQVWER